MPNTGAYTGAQAELYVEAVRTVVALAGARLRGNAGDAATLYEGYLDDARRLGLTDKTAWSILAVAGVMWTTTLMHRHGVVADLNVDELVAETAGLATEWVTGV